MKCLVGMALGGFRFPLQGGHLKTVNRRNSFYSNPKVIKYLVGLS